MNNVARVKRRCYHLPAMSIVPYRHGGRVPKRRALNQATIVRTALALLDEVGLDDLTMSDGQNANTSNRVPAP